MEVYPYIEYAKYLLAGSTALAIFIVAMIGGGITFIDDKSRGLHEGYLLTPIHKTSWFSGWSARGNQGPFRGDGAHHHRRAARWHSQALGSRAPLLSHVGRFGGIGGMISFMFLAMVRVDGSAGPARDFWRSQYAPFFPFGCNFSH